MINGTDAEVIRLEREHQNWHCWVVHHYIGGPRWCARPWAAGDDATQSISAASPDELAELMEAAETA